MDAVYDSFDTSGNGKLTEVEVFSLLDWLGLEPTANDVIEFVEVTYAVVVSVE